jgi:pSer/pThr/pTyr-binding forkhead associated (FHA) protein
MTELWLKFNDENGEPQNVLVDRENFLIGRSPDNDLRIPLSQLSRTHAEINRFGDTFVISDCNSSNGTTLNGQNLYNPIALKNDDRINFGGGIEVRVELADSNANVQYLPDDAPVESNEGSFENDNTGVNEQVSAPPAPTGKPAATAAPSQGTFSGMFLIIAPILGVVILLFAGGLLLLFGGRKQNPPVSDTDDYAYSSKKDSDSKRKTKTEDDEDEDKTPTPKPKDSPGVTETPSASTLTTSSTPTPISSEVDKVERNVLPFMRRIAVKDDTYVFTRKQLDEINSQIKSFKGSANLRENLKSVKKSAAQFEELAKSKGLKPQFLATAALAKIGNQNQNPLSVAQTMLPVLGELRITLNNELSDDNLLIIAAYDLGEQGKFRAMQSTLEALSKQVTGVAANKIRTIWFLRERGKISDAQYAFALRFLAIGAITQNPKDFNVDTEAVVFN